MSYEYKDWAKVDTAGSKPEPISATTKISVFAKFMLVLLNIIRKKEH